MKKLIKLIIFWLLPIFFVLLITFATNIFISDFRLSHQSHMVYHRPFNWSFYYIKMPIKKFIINTFYSKKEGLPRVYLYIGEKSQQKLISKTPNSTKLWSDGSMLNQKNGKLQNISVRYRGDNPQNWLFYKKALRIKTRKREMHGRRRYYEYTPFKLGMFISNDIAKRMNILTSNSKLIELFINGQSNGIFIEDERYDENFLRRNKLMPVNLYKGENHNTESKIGIDKNLFNNPGSWTKTAIFNQRKKEDKSDLENFLSIIQSAETKNKDYKKLFSYINLDTWSNYAAYLVLAQSYHSDHFHNLRIAIDPWSGFVNPIVKDPIFKWNDAEVLPLEYSKDDLLVLLNRSSIFIDKKYEKLFHYTINNRVLNDEVNYLKTLRDNLEISGKRDAQINIRKILSDLDVYKKELIKMEKHVKNKLFSKPISSWHQQEKKINIFIDGEIPASDIKFTFRNKAPEWIGLDTNYSGAIEDNEIKFFSNGKKEIVIPGKFYSNRISLNNRKVEMHVSSSISTANTKFNLILQENISPINISVKNPFSGEVYQVDNKNIKGVHANKFNKIIFDKNENKEIVFSNEVIVNKNLVINNPVLIYPGTKFLLNEDSHVIFNNKVLAKGTDDNPIKFIKKNNSSKPWGTIALLGHLSSNSEFTNVIIDGGSGGNFNQINFTSMLSLHNTKNIKLKKIKLTNHSKYDDMIHIIYCDGITIDKAELAGSFGDAIDVDISRNIIIRNSKFLDSKNDAIDFMESEALVDSVNIVGSNDKGISVGESSNILIYNTIFKDNDIALAVKDKSVARVLNANFENNRTQLSAYRKNWQYGSGGDAYIYRSYFKSDKNLIKSSSESSLLINDVSIVGKKLIEGKNIKVKNVDFFENFNKEEILKTKKSKEKNNLILDHPMFAIISKIENENRGIKN